MKKILKYALWFAHNNDGIAYVEFAISITFLLTLFLGSVEVSRFVMINEKAEKVVQTVTDVVAQDNPQTSPLTTNQLTQLMSAVQDMMNPYTFGRNGLVLISDITKTGAANPIVKWQYCGGGTLSTTSHIGTVGGTATLPSGFTMNSGEEVVIGEVIYNYTPIVTQSIIGNTTVYKYAVYAPRLGALSSFTSTCP